jgi:hypothetical protein
MMDYKKRFHILWYSQNENGTVDNMILSLHAMHW